MTQSYFDPWQTSTCSVTLAQAYSWDLTSSTQPAWALAVPSAILNHKNTGLWVTNFSPTLIDIQSNTRLAEATPLAPDDITVLAGSFCLNEATANPTKVVKKDSFVSDAVSTDEAALKLIKNSTNLSPSYPSVEINETQPVAEPWLSIINPQQHRASFSSLTSAPLSTVHKRSDSFDNHWPRVSCLSALTSPQTEVMNNTQPLNFSNDPLAQLPELINLNTTLMDHIFQVGRDAQGQPHPSIVTVLRVTGPAQRS
ncbi:hypothetical protein NDA11_003107 [Ustilago hordei]|uniref:Uncharacterized protein n=1 Tax=Ustilago hordei TaxID=120017 RepID=I2FSW7_USTHO|nr:hypothetical protein NDA10_000394 [Ustilago hordei]KAJ1570726.1 hypothetical protein NDA11_003107 [Ustilago hordei]KAJ1587242.1 hypothetical protein NDA15_003510 [Ustilago hordei]KAJ1590017.1 hypothetical protein NDA12_003174 [Ustilago hordei]UTT96580.1 hypothetical protein NDA17_000206 [Ustilago hordei]